MIEPDFANAALVLVGHGTSEDPDSAAVIYQHAAELRRRKIFAEVREAFWKQQPVISEVLSALQLKQLFIVPFFMSAGYFCERIIPEALGFGGVRPQRRPWRTQTRDGSEWIYCQPVGTHSGVTDLVIERGQEALRNFPFPRAPQLEMVDLVLAGHGTERDENSTRAAEEHAKAIRERRVFAAIHTVFLEDEPRINRFSELSTSRNVVVVPFFVGEGPHVKQDVPLQLGASARTIQERLAGGQWPWRNPTEIRGKLVWYSRAVGTHPGMAEIVWDRAKQAASALA